MPLMNAETSMKVCSTCRQEKDTRKNTFYSSSTTKDHWQYRCIECWSKPAAETRPEERCGSTAVEVRRPKVPTGFSHSADDIRHIEERDALRFVEWLDIGGVKVPVLESKTNPPAKRKKLD